jgi:hypothetical protein
MRSLYLCVALCIMALAASTAVAADNGQVSSATLTQMGLAGMSTVSDAQGDLVRGKGFAPKVSVMCAGQSFTIGNAVSATQKVVQSPIASKTSLQQGASVTVCTEAGYCGGGVVKTTVCVSQSICVTSGAAPKGH